MTDFVFYLRLGWEHIMSLAAQDHLLFLLALVAVYTLTDWKAVLVLVTAFTIGHSLTLALSTLHLLTVPSAWVEFFIPCTIIVTAAAHLIQKTSDNRFRRLNYAMALFFGLIHGLGFANTLRFILADDQSLGWALFGFNIGLEAGQVLVVAALLVLAHIAFTYFRVPRRDWIVFLSAAALSMALQLAVQRWPGKTHRRSESVGFLNQKSIWAFEKVARVLI